ncbi:MAG: hypothetical protein M1165_02445 [Candidatus Pacearchaeota archaeon]|nr:hypothetical protein [Candidatus Pacearchaeota archaeon]
MRKIISKQEEERKKRRNQLIVGGILIGVMLLSTLGYAFQSYLYGDTSSTVGTNQTATYNGITFVNQNGYWVLQYQNQRLAFAYNPLQISLKNLSGISMSLNSLANKTLYIYSEDYNSESELRINLLHFTDNIQNACPEGIQCNQSLYQGQQLPAKDCSNNFIIIESGSSGIKQEQNCVFISEQGQNLISSTDNFLFKLFGIAQ